MKKILVLTILAFFLGGCWLRDNTDPGPKATTNAKGEIVEQKPLWTFNLHELEPVSNNIIRAHLVENNKVVLATTKGKGVHLYSCVDVNNGEVLWRWNDVFNPSSDNLSISEVYFRNEAMFFGVGGHRFALDMISGQTKWKFKIPFDITSSITGIENTYFLVGRSQDTLASYQTYCGYRGSVQVPEGIERFLITDIDTTTGGVDNLITTVNDIESMTINGHHYLGVVSSDPYPNWNYDVFYGLYDYDAGQWLYNRKLVSEPSQANAGLHLEYFENKVYVSAGNKIACFDFATGERLWRREFPLDFMFSRFIVREGLVVANCENNILYGLDASTGVTRWQGEGAGTSSRLEDRYLNGVVYFSGGSTGRIHAVDVQTGKTLWRLESGYLEPGTDDWKPDLYVVPGQNGEKGRVIACTFLNAYCFEAAR